MMKKLLSLSAIAMATMMSAQVNAAAVEMTTSGTITSTMCPALSNNVQVQLSSGVIASFNCDGESFMSAACHTSGTNKAQTVDCVYVAEAVAPGDACTDVSCQVPQVGYTGCPAASTVAVPPGDPAFPKAEFNGRVAFGGGSSGGRVGLLPLGDEVCGTTGIKTVTPDTSLNTGISTSGPAT